MSTNLAFIKNQIINKPVRIFSAFGAVSTATIWGIYTPYSMSKDNKYTNFAIDEFKKAAEQSNNKRELTGNCIKIQNKLIKQFKMTSKKAKFILSSTIETINSSKESNKSWLNNLDLSKKEQLIEYIDNTQKDFNDAYKKTKNFMPIMLGTVGAAVGAGIGAATGGLVKLAQSLRHSNSKNLVRSASRNIKF